MAEMLVIFSVSHKEIMGNLPSAFTPYKYEPVLNFRYLLSSDSLHGIRDALLKVNSRVLDSPLVMLIVQS